MFTANISWSGFSLLSYFSWKFASKHFIKFIEFNLLNAIFIDVFSDTTTSSPVQFNKNYLIFLL